MYWCIMQLARIKSFWYLPDAILAIALELFGSLSSKYVFRKSLIKNSKLAYGTVASLKLELSKSSPALSCNTTSNSDISWLYRIPLSLIFSLTISFIRKSIEYKSTGKLSLFLISRVRN